MEKLNDITIDAYEFKLKYIFEKIFKFSLYKNDYLIVNIKDINKSTFKERLLNFKLRLNELLEPISFNDKKKAFEYTICIYGNPKHFNIKLQNISVDNINEQLKLYFIAKINDEIEDFIMFQKYNNKFCKVLTRTSNAFFKKSFIDKVLSINVNFYSKVMIFLSNLLYNYYKLNIIDIQLINNKFYFSVMYNNYMYLCEDLPKSISQRILLQFSHNEYSKYKKENPYKILSLIKRGELVPVINFNEKIDFLKNNLIQNDSILLSSIQELFQDNNVDKNIFNNFINIVKNSQNQKANIEQIENATNDINQKNNIIMNLLNKIIGDKDINLNDMNIYFFIMELINGLIEINSPNKNIYLFMNDINLEDIDESNISKISDKKCKQQEKKVYKNNISNINNNNK